MPLRKSASAQQTTPSANAIIQSEIGRIVRVKYFGRRTLHNTTGTIVAKGRGVERIYFIVRLSDEKELFHERKNIVDLYCLAEEIEFIK